MSEHAFCRMLLGAAKEEAKAGKVKIPRGLVAVRADDLGKTVSLMGKPYTIAGYLVRSTRNPILVKDAKGKSWRMPLYLVTAALEKVRGKVSNQVAGQEEPFINGIPSISELVKQGFTGENNEDSRRELEAEAAAELRAEARMS